MHFGYIYEIRNDINGHTYVGKHKCSADNDKYMGSGKVLRQAYKKYGKQHFTKKILSYSLDLRDLNITEKMWITEYRSLGKAEYNIADGGEGGRTGPVWNKGKHHSEETRRKMSDAWDYDKHFTKETRQKIAEAGKGRTFSEEHKRKIGEANKGKPCYWKGKHHSEEYKRKMSEACKDKPSPNKGKHWKKVNGKRVYF